MNLRLALASVWLPGFVRRARLRELLRRSAEAFGVSAPAIAGRSHRELLNAFATFTAWQVAAIGRNDAGGSPGATAAVRARLRATACDLGRDLRRTLKVRTPAQAMQAARLVYATLGIDFEGAVDGTIVIRRCGFSRIYSPPACAVVSGLDEGLLAGLTDRPDGQLEFSRRITEGCDRCVASFRSEPR